MCSKSVSKKWVSKRQHPAWSLLAGGGGGVAHFEIKIVAFVFGHPVYSGRILLVLLQILRITFCLVRIQVWLHRKHRRTGPFPLGGGGGAQHFMPEFLILTRKFNMFWAMHFCRTWGGGVWRRKILLFEVIVYRKPWRERVSPSHSGEFVGFGGTKTGFLVGYTLLINLNSSSHVCNDCSIKGGGGAGPWETGVLGEIFQGVLSTPCKNFAMLFLYQ